MALPDPVGIADPPDRILHTADLRPAHEELLPDIDRAGQDFFACHLFILFSCHLFSPFPLLRRPSRADNALTRPDRQRSALLNITGTFTPLVRIEETIVPD